MGERAKEKGCGVRVYGGISSGGLCVWRLA